MQQAAEVLTQLSEMFKLTKFITATKDINDSTLTRLIQEIMFIEWLMETDSLLRLGQI